MILKVKKLNDCAMLPTRAHKTDAGYDLYSTEFKIIRAGSYTTVSTGIAIQIPDGYYGRVAPRSGLACKYGIDVFAGVVDCGYRGELKVVLFNASDRDFNMASSERIAQLIITKIETPDVEEVDSFEETDRGETGFGSTGK